MSGDDYCGRPQKPGSELATKDAITAQKLLVTIGQLNREIKHRKKKQRVLALECDRNHQLIEAVPSILIGVNSGGLITLWNQSAEITFDIRSGMAIGKSFASVEPCWEWSEIDEAIKSSSGLFRATLDTVKYEKPDGSEVFLKFTLNSVFEDGKENGFLLVGSDITEKLRLRMQSQLSQKMEAIGELAGGIAHEINTPLQYITDNIRFLGECFDDLEAMIERYQNLKDRCAQLDVVPELIDKLNRQDEEADINYIKGEVPLAITQSMDGLSKASSIVGAMKEFSHPGNKEKELCDINRALRNTITVSENEWKYVAELTTAFDGHIPLIHCYSELNQVFLNIIINAADAIEEKLGGDPSEKGQITIKSLLLEETICVEISDTAGGIAEDDLMRIFDPFFTTKEVGKGTGQGLAISYDIVVNKHRGSLEVDSVVGEGTTFRVLLPIVSAADNAS